MLLHLLLAALPGSTQLPSPNAPKPVLLEVPDIGLVRFYLWTTTPDKSTQGRPEGEHKSQIIIPGTARGSKQHLTFDKTPTFAMGYSPLFKVFIIWEAARHQDAAYSKNMQVRSELLQEATDDGWTIDVPRRTSLGPEVRAAIHPSHLLRFLKLSIQADAEGLSGSKRQAFLMAGAPDLDDPNLTAKVAAGEPIDIAEVERARVAATGTRLKRNITFSRRILDQFGHRCAVCQMQLSILEGAHIIPVHDPKGSDEIWNGLALCPNHHRLFDRRIWLIDSSAFVRADEETLNVLRDTSRFHGYDQTIGVYRDKVVQRLPAFFQTNQFLTQRMTEALRLTYELS